MSSLLNSLSLLNFTSPYWLVGIPLFTGMLIYIYRKRGSSKKVVFGSLFIIKQLVQTTSAKKKLRIPLRLLFDLLLIILLLLIIADPYLKSKVDHVALLIDNSYSTQALINNQNSRIDNLRKDALDFLNRQKENTKIDLWTSTSSQPVALEENMNSINNLVEAIKVENKSDNFNQQLQAITNNPKISKIVIFTDKDLKKIVQVNSRLDQNFATNTKDFARENIAISELKVEANNTLTLKLDYYAATSEKPRTAQVLIEISRSGEIELSKLVELKAYKSEVKTFQLNKPGKYRVQIKTEEFDSVLDDNSRSFEFNLKTKKIAYLGARDLENLNLNLLKDYQFIKESIETLSPSKYILAISDSNTIVNLGLPTIFNLPLSDSLQKRAIKIENQVNIVSWKKASPFLRYLDFKESKLSKAITYQSLIGDQVLIQGESGALLLKNHDNQYEQIVSGIDLFPYQGQKDLFKSIILLNLIKELRDNQRKVNFSDQKFFSVLESDTYKIQQLVINQEIQNAKNLNFNTIKIFNNQQLSENLIKLLLILLLIEVLSRPMFYGFRKYVSR